MVEVEEIKLDWKTAKYRFWNIQKKKWFYLVEQKSSLPFSQFLVEAKEDGELYFACSLHSSPWIWGKKERIK